LRRVPLEQTQKAVAEDDTAARDQDYSHPARHWMEELGTWHRAPYMRSEKANDQNEDAEPNGGPVFAHDYAVAINSSVFATGLDPLSWTG